MGPIRPRGGEGIGLQGPNREVPPLSHYGRPNPTRGGSPTPPEANAPRGTPSTFVAAPSSPLNRYILEDFHPMMTQVLEPRLVDLVLVLVGPT